MFPSQQDKGEEASGSTKPAPPNQPPPSSRPPHRWHVIARHWLRQTRRRTSGVLPVTSTTRRTHRIAEPQKPRRSPPASHLQKPLQLEEQTPANITKTHWRQHTAAWANALFSIASGFKMDEFRWGYWFFLFLFLVTTWTHQWQDTSDISVSICSFDFLLISFHPRLSSSGRGVSLWNSCLDGLQENLL